MTYWLLKNFDCKSLLSRPSPAPPPPPPPAVLIMMFAHKCQKPKQNPLSGGIQLKNNDKMLACKLSAFAK